eukprot:TRINITY_DN55358_c0_g1_i1.p1 TRINITY_DN55358_c0_g1~~TRINITY_DN55358_c0_g1_i1.p1  ORF type:complete len:380 (+),score=119.69 TRINITY_DN55358_c0_g1_i1:78-1142(+)
MDLLWGAPKGAPLGPQKRSRAPSLPEQALPPDVKLDQAAGGAALDAVFLTAHERDSESHAGRAVESVQAAIRAKLQAGLFPLRCDLEGALVRLCLRMAHADRAAHEGQVLLRQLPAVLAAARVGHSDWLCRCCGAEGLQRTPPSAASASAQALAARAMSAADAAERILAEVPPNSALPGSIPWPSVAAVRQIAEEHGYHTPGDVREELLIACEAAVPPQQAAAVRRRVLAVLAETGLLQLPPPAPRMPPRQAARARRLLRALRDGAREDACYLAPWEGEIAYRSVVAHPMDLLTVEAKLEAGRYSCAAALVDDLRSIPATMMPFVLHPDGAEDRRDLAALTGQLDRLLPRHRLP